MTATVIIRRGAHRQRGAKVAPFDVSGGRVAGVMAAVVLWLCTAALVSPTAAQPPSAPQVPDDRAISVGRWDVAAVEVNGKPVDPEILRLLRVVYRADGTWAVLLRSLPVAEGTSTYRQDDSPKTFEMATLGSERIAPSRYSGIYKHDGDTRVLCFVPDGEPRPDRFVAPRRSGRTLVTLRRSADP